LHQEQHASAERDAGQSLIGAGLDRIARAFGLKLQIKVDDEKDETGLQRDQQHSGGIAVPGDDVGGGKITLDHRHTMGPDRTFQGRGRTAQRFRRLRLVRAGNAEPAGDRIAEPADRLADGVGCGRQLRTHAARGIGQCGA